MSHAPAIGRIVHYTLSDDDARRIGHQRSLGSLQGNGVRAGEVYPMLITRVWDSGKPNPDAAVNGQVLLDGSDSLWVTSVKVGEGPRTYAWPVIA